MIDVTREDLLNLKAACREPVYRNPTTGKPAHISSPYRHAQRGARSVNGQVVKLETVRTPRGRMTSRQAIARFIAALNGISETGAPPTPEPGNSPVDSACAELAAAGFQV